MANGILPPGLRGFVAAEQMAQQRAANELNQITGVLALQNSMRQQAFQQQTQPLQLKMLETQVRNAQNPSPLLKDLGGSIGIFDPRTFQKLGELPKSVSPDAAARAQAQRDTSVLNPDVVNARQSIAAAGAPRVDVKVDQKTGESFAKEIGPMMTDSRSSALSALSAVETAQRIGSAISQGNVTLGPTATLRNKTDQVAQLFGVGGNTTEERLVNTRNVIRGLSQFTIAARKQLKGQGQVSDYEGKLLQRAESGEIEDFTLPELRDFIGVTDKLARQTYGEHQRMLGVMKGDPRTSGFVPYYSVPDLPNPTAAGRTVKRTGTYQGKKVIEYSDGTIEEVK